MSKKARDAARELLKRFGTKIPIDITAIVKAHNISVSAEDLETSVSGILVIKAERVYLAVNQFHPDSRLRFTEAHELGHYLLHRDLSNVFIDETPMFHGDKRSKFYRDKRSTPGDPIEVEANVFAAELLMPEEVLRARVVKGAIEARDEDAIRKLAAQFGVSSLAMEIRLKSLRLIPK